jgi:uridine kinase
MKERGRSIESVLNQYEKTVKPSFDEFIAPTKQYAHIIIPRGGDNDVAVTLLVEHIRSQLHHRSTYFTEKFSQGTRNENSAFLNVNVMPSTPRIASLISVLRNEKSSMKEVISSADAICFHLVSYAIKLLPLSRSVLYESDDRLLCGVSIVRSGEPLTSALRMEFPDLPIGKLVIQQSLHKSEGPRLFYYKFPRDVKDRYVILTDAVFASANAITMAIRVLLDHECQEDKIMLLCIAAAPEGVSVVNRLFPKVTIVICSLEQGVDEDLFLIPGMGSFSKRYYG